jgi:hypothetical protein
MKLLHQQVSQFFGHAFLDLRAMSQGFDDARHLAQADDATCSLAGNPLRAAELDVRGREAE